MTRRRSAWTLGLMVALLFGATGCQSVRLPAIDPSGQRIFLPPPASTTLVPPELPDCRLPQPAFTRPAEPPACPEGVAAPPAGPTGCSPPGVAGTTRPGETGPRAGEHHAGTRLGRLVLQPGRVVAPVGTEVVLIAGLCDPDGYYVIKQPIEWVLSQESVGHFVDAADWGFSLIPAALRKPAGKISSNYVVTRTASHAATFTRGTAQTTDDFVIKRGQTWVSVTSPSEGVTYVTVWAPNAQGWDVRRQTAVIHWVDAQWQLPSPAVVAAGEPHLLRVKVTRTSGAPAEGWRVRFELIDGPPAGFAPSGARDVTVPVDAQGEAAVQVVPQTRQPGLTRVRMQIIRPGHQSGEPAELVLGEGWTSISWSSPGLAVRVDGPPRGASGETLQFQVTVANVGDLYARNVFLRDALPPTWQRVDATPNPVPMGDAWQWNLGDIGPGDSRTVTVRCRPQRDGLARYCFQAIGEGSVQAEGCIDVDVFTVQLQLRVRGPETAAVGERVTYYIELTNTGQTPLTRVRLRDQFDPGLQHSEGQASPIERDVGTLAPGETRSDLAVSFVVLRPGKWCHVVEAYADGGHRARVEQCLTATVAAPSPMPTTPALQVRLTGPPQLEVGQTGLYVIEMRNTSSAAFSGVRVTVRFDRPLRPIQATTGAVAAEAGQAIAWTLREIPAGGMELREVECRAVRPAESATAEVTVTTTEGIQEKAQTATRVSGEAPRESIDLTPPGTPGGTPPDALRVNLIALDNPVRVGQATRLLLEIQNPRSDSDRNVTVTFILPPDTKVQRVAGPGVTSRLAGTVLRFEPVAELRGGETLRPPYEVEIVPSKPGRITVVAQIESLRLGKPIEVKREIDVNQ